MQTMLFLFILVPSISGLLIFLLSKSARSARSARSAGSASRILGLLAGSLNFLIAVFLFHKEMTCSIPWAGFGMDFSLRLNHFSGFIILAAAFFSLLVVIYSLKFFKDKDNSS